MKSKRIYLISEDGCAVGNTEAGAQALEAVGYRRCTQDEYKKQLRKVASKDEKAMLDWLESLDEAEAEDEQESIS